MPLHKYTGVLSGVLWLELDCQDVLSEPVPVVLCPNMDVVDELNELEDDLEAGRWAHVPQHISRAVSHQQGCSVRT